MGHETQCAARSQLWCPVRIADHWDQVYADKQANELSWFQESPETSLRLLSAFGDPACAVIDVGAGESTLADRLLDLGWVDVNVLDVSQEALALVKKRLADRAGISYVCADLLHWKPPRQFDAWHDRAVLHFLTNASDRNRYIDLCASAVRPGGTATIGTFAVDGPTECSGLPTCRYDSQTLSDLFAPHFTLEHHEREEHPTPGGGVQHFAWSVLRRT